MKFRLLTLCLLLAEISLHAQKQTPADVEAGALAIHDKIYRFDYNPEIDHDDVDKYDFLCKANKQLTNHLLTASNIPGIMHYKFDSLTANHCVVSTSADNKVKIFSWDDMAGGSMRYYNSIIYYAGDSVNAESICMDTCGDNSYDEYCPFYRDIYAFKTTKGTTFYLVLVRYIMSSGIGMDEIQTFKLDGNKLIWDIPIFRIKTKLVSKINYQYDITTGGPNENYRGDLNIKIDTQKGTIDFPLIDEKEVITSKRLLYRFNGNVFVFDTFIDAK